MNSLTWVRCAFEKALAVLVALGCLLGSSPATAQRPFLVKNLDTRSGDANVRYLGATRGGLVVRADDGVHGNELWLVARSRRFPTGVGLAEPVLLGDLQPGPFGSYPGSPAELPGLLLFSATDPIHGRELWRTDGSPAGTYLLADIREGPESSQPFRLTTVGRRVFFIAADEAHGAELWSSDGTRRGTRLVRDIRRGPDSSSVNSPLRALLGSVFFSADDGVHGEELWRADASGRTARLVADLRPGPVGSSVTELVELGDLVVMSVDNGLDHELWKSDGSEAGTSLLADIDPLGSSRPSELTVADDFVFFRASEPGHGSEVWRTDGTAAGTHLVKDLEPGPTGSRPSLFHRLGDEVVFKANTWPHGTELWASDGTARGTRLIKNIFPGFEGSDPFELRTVRGEILFSARSYLGRELWKTDGTHEGTVMVKDIWPAWDDGFRGGAVVAGDRLFFRGNDGVHGTELWTSDGTADGARLVEDVVPNGGLSAFYPPPIRPVGRLVVLPIDDGQHGEELWISDATPEGTYLAGDINVRMHGSDPVPFVAMDRTVLFWASHPTGLYRSNGSDSGTIRLLETRRGEAVALDGQLILGGFELLKSDGTQGGTVALRDRHGRQALYPDHFFLVGDTLFFEAFDADHGREIWRTNGHPAGTYRVKDIVPGPAGIRTRPADKPRGTAGGLFFFVMDDGIHGLELWRSDGTVSGTFLLKNISPAGCCFYQGPRELTALGGTLYFVADDGVHGTELWQTDGTPSGTVLVEDLYPGAGGSYPASLIAVGDTLYFAASDGVHGREIFKLAHGAREARLVADIDTGTCRRDLWEYHQSLTELDGRLFFVGFQCDYGLELWTSDGTKDGTALTRDIIPGRRGS